MAIETYTVQLERVQGLIKSIEESPNKSVTIVNRSWDKHDLADLYEREKYLRSMATREARGGKVRVIQVAPL